MNAVAIPDGPHLVRVWLEDEAGNADRANAATLAVDPSTISARRAVEHNPPVFTRRRRPGLPRHERAAARVDPDAERDDRQGGHQPHHREGLPWQGVRERAHAPDAGPLVAQAQAHADPPARHHVLGDAHVRRPGSVPRVDGPAAADDEAPD